MKYNIVSTLIVALFSLSNFSFSQKKVYSSDTAFVGIKRLEIGSVSVSLKDFEVNPIKNGSVSYYETSDSSHKKIDQFLEIRGEYFNGMKEGVFKYYFGHVGNYKNEETFPLRVKLNYKSGFLDGNAVVYAEPGVKYYEGSFKNGLQDGIFITYYRFPTPGNVEVVEYFKEGELIYKQEFKLDSNFGLDVKKK